MRMCDTAFVRFPGIRNYHHKGCYEEILMYRYSCFAFRFQLVGKFSILSVFKTDFFSGPIQYIRLKSHLSCER
jgi:hypothetical protein